MMKREELSRIASVKFQKALSDRARAVTPRVLAFCVMAVSLVFTLAVTAANLRLTYVTDSDGARQLVVSSETDPARVMSLSGIEAEEGDHVYYTAFSGNLASLNIERAFSVSITADGQEYPVKLVYGTVADALERAGITLEADDYTEPALDQLVTAGSEITVHRVDYQDKVETQTIPYDTQYVYTSLYFRNTGRATTLQHGAEGQQTVTTHHGGAHRPCHQDLWCRCARFSPDRAGRYHQRPRLVQPGPHRQGHGLLFPHGQGLVGPGPGLRHRCR